MYRAAHIALAAIFVSGQSLDLAHTTEANLLRTFKAVIYTKL